MMAYREKVVDHYKNPQNVGSALVLSGHGFSRAVKAQQQRGFSR
jgi:NifU-like protein involved in Fe-S cluster formation